MWQMTSNVEEQMLPGRLRPRPGTDMGEIVGSPLYRNSTAGAESEFVQLLYSSLAITLHNTNSFIDFSLKIYNM